MSDFIAEFNQIIENKETSSFALNIRNNSELFINEFSETMFDNYNLHDHEEIL